METIIILPKDKAELKFFVELAERLGTKFKTLDEFQDEQLLDRMLENLNTPLVEKENIMDQLHTILNEDQPPYTNED
ncbi:hypothetical protein [Draconibacterium halophilum]|uniref:Uncharacterized protein n=1 Tax=Draconibacterium halophilum TaxID=2706887 RepID=A0A6C0RFU2_9BACT|nr:hypothetical protein [Draconibacterium halophilum]QIA08535.1 hypothetical protein G0Q07_12770 [Draconibacterium halophilum]